MNVQFPSDPVAIAFFVVIGLCVATGVFFIPCDDCCGRLFGRHELVDFPPEGEGNTQVVVIVNDAYSDG